MSPDRDGRGNENFLADPAPNSWQHVMYEKTLVP